MQLEEQPSVSSLALLLDTPDEGLYMIDSQWRYTYVNSKAAQLVGRPIEALLGRNIWHLFPEAVDTIIYTQAHRAVGERIPLSFEVYYPPLTTWFESHLYLASDMLVVLSKDITARKQMEQQHQRQAALLELITEPIIVWKFQGPILYWNRGAELLYGFSKDEAIGRSTHDLLQTKHFEPLKQIYETLLRTGKWEGQLIHTAKDGRQIVVDCVKALSREDDGSQFIMETNRDFTQRKELEQRKDEFISMTSHELKTPITTLKGYNQLLRMRLMQQGNQEAIPMLNKMEGQVNRLNKLIDELLVGSKIQAGRLDYEEEPVDVDALVHDMVELLQATTTTHVLNVSGSTKAIIIGDKDRLSQVLTNLITNAIKYSPQASSVDIVLARSQKSVSIAVHDYGVGIPKAAQRHIFERFYRVHGEQEKAFPGLGMGLYIASEIVKRHGGTITVESEEGKGSIFMVTLPLNKESRGQ